MQWFNDPPSWEEKEGTIIVTSGAKTDFWRKTRHDFIQNNGNFYHQEVTGDFTAQVKIAGKYNSQYDQAGLMLTLDEFTWMKCGVELMDGVQQISVVITRDYSDWSMIPMFTNPDSTWMRVKRIGSAIEVYFSRDGDNFFLMRQGFLTQVETIQVGLMVASPTGEGFVTTFENYEITLDRPDLNNTNHKVDV